MRIAFMLLGVLLVSGCANVVPCSSSNCDGCCVADVCMTGAGHDSCGKVTCGSCTVTQACSNYTCISASLLDGVEAHVVGVTGDEQIFHFDQPLAYNRATISLTCVDFAPDLDERTSGSSTNVWDHHDDAVSTSASITLTSSTYGRHDVRVFKAKDLYSYTSSCGSYDRYLYGAPEPYTGERYCEPQPYDCRLEVTFN